MNPSSRSMKFGSKLRSASLSTWVTRREVGWGTQLGSGRMCDAARNFAISRPSVLAELRPELRLENYALIDHVDIEFALGLVLLTGEGRVGEVEVCMAEFTSRRFFPPQRTC
jgi:1,4-dihydroxy-2-naphthoyl-CoA synthase